ncbi:hypothetical protein Sjap_017744 [Stephania japonica]|uniref:Uncharacterized protein n=1 Tax=Stephania japonica TaxID=461633 RepID=A0AAP0I6R9_9MAGN
MFECSHKRVDVAAKKRLAINDEVRISVSRTVLFLATEMEDGLNGLGFIEKDAHNWARSYGVRPFQDFGNHTSNETERHDVIGLRCTRLANLGCMSKKKFKKIIDAIHNLVLELQAEPDNESDDEEVSEREEDAQSFLNPEPVRAKGRPKENTPLKALVEKVTNKKQNKV